MGLGTRVSLEQKVVAIGKVRDGVIRVWAGLDMGKKKREELARKTQGARNSGSCLFKPEILFIF